MQAGFENTSKEISAKLSDNELQRMFFSASKHLLL
jgi:hypothetical protein